LNARSDRLWKRRAETALGNQKAISTFPQPQQQQTFGYISNVPTTQPTVTFSFVRDHAAQFQTGF
jgi:hypothetical protein